MADLKYFMRPENKEEEIVEIPGVASIADEKGNPIPYKVKVLSQTEITEINNRYKKRKLCCDKKGKPYTNGNMAIYQEETDAARALRHIMVEAIVDPNLKDKKLMDFYKISDITDLPTKIWSNTRDFNEVQNQVLTAIGILGNADEDVDEVEEAKN